MNIFHARILGRFEKWFNKMMDDYPDDKDLHDIGEIIAAYRLLVEKDQTHS